jgi:hypothetical protein
VVINRVGDEHPACIGQGFEPRSDIDPVAENVVLLGDHVAEIDADAKPDPPLLGHLGLAVGHPALDLNRASNGVHNTRKLRQEAIASVLHGTAVVFVDFRIDQLPQMRLEPLVRSFLVHPHQARIAHHIGGEDRGETAGRGHGSGSPPWSKRSSTA